jgi:rhodanese-related sulfurtransferase
MSLTAQDLVAAAKQQIGHLKGAINIPRGLLEFKIGAHPDFQQQQQASILVYCQTGGRSALATQVLNQLGYAQAVSMAGGFNAWTEAGLPVG